MNVYNSMGVVVENPIVVLAISLPRPSTPSDYVIAGVYEPTSITDNVILVHFQDSSSTALSNPDNNFESFILDLSNLTNGVYIVNVKTQSGISNSFKIIKK